MSSRLERIVNEDDELNQAIWGEALTESERALIEGSFERGDSAKWLRFLLKVHDARERWFAHVVGSWKQEEEDWVTERGVLLEERDQLLAQRDERRGL